MKYSLWGLAALSLPLPALVTPAQATDSVADNTVLTPMVVTANRMPQSVNDTLESVTVISREDIDRLQPESLGDLLAGRAGIEVTANGGQGSVTSLFMRGTESDHVLVLINGIRQNQLQSGGFRWELINPAMIERVEIVRGPQSSAWGADALGGVINIITRQGAEGSQVQYSRGRYDSWKLEANTSAGNEQTQLNLAASREETDGFNAQGADVSGERDGFEQTSLNLGLDHRFNQQLKGHLSILHTDNKGDYDALYTDEDDVYYEQDSTQIASHLDIQLNSHWMVRLLAGQTDTESRDYTTAERPDPVRTRRQEYGIQHLFQDQDYSATLGIDYRLDRLLETEGFERDRRENYGAYAQMRYYLTHDWALSSGIRFDDDEFFGHHTTGHIGTQWQFTPTQSVGASVAQGFRAPSFQELYKPAWGGNPDLDPEESVNYEAYWQWAPDDTQQLRLTAFRNDIDDLIGTDSQFNYYNVGEARINGVELQARQQWGPWLLNLATTWQDAEDRDTGERLLKRADLFARLDLDYRWQQASLGATVRSSGDRDDFGGAHMGGYTTYDLRASWTLNDRWVLRGKLENLSDKTYETAKGYNIRGRYWEASVALRF